MTNLQLERLVLVNPRFFMSWILCIMVWLDHGKFYALVVQEETKHIVESFLTKLKPKNLPPDNSMLLKKSKTQRIRIRVHPYFVGDVTKLDDNDEANRWEK